MNTISQTKTSSIIATKRCDAGGCETASGTSPRPHSQSSCGEYTSYARMFSSNWVKREGSRPGERFTVLTTC